MHVNIFSFFFFFLGTTQHALARAQSRDEASSSPRIVSTQKNGRFDAEVLTPLFTQYILVVNTGQRQRNNTEIGQDHNLAEMAYIALLEGCIYLFEPDLYSENIFEKILVLKKQLKKQIHSRRNPENLEKMIQRSNFRKYNQGQLYTNLKPQMDAYKKSCVSARPFFASPITEWSEAYGKLSSLNPYSLFASPKGNLDSLLKCGKKF